MLKNLLLKTFSVAMCAGIIFSGCEGPEGPAGADGATGATGAAGADGSSALVNVTAEAAGDNCANGGFRIDVGVDADNNGTLEATEISSTQYVCGGSNSLVNVTEEPEGDNCENGGFLIETGVDDNGDGTLDASEVDDTFYLCDGVDFVNELRSTLRPLVTLFGGFKTVSAEALVSSLDVLPTSSGGTMQIGGSADGAGAVLNSDGDLELLVNFEDHYAVARLTINVDSLRSDYTAGSSSIRGRLVASIIEADYLLNSSVSDFARQCSGTMWESAIHGGTEDIFISASETWNYVNKGIDPHATAITPDAPARRFDAMGQFGFENAVPLPQNAFAGSTIIIGGDDDYKFNAGGGGSVTLYYSTGGDAEFDNGDAYVLRLANGNDGQIDGAPADESDLEMGVDYAVEFVTVSDMPDTLDTVLEWDAASLAVNALEFVRVEDIDYGKGSDAANRTLYIAVTGRGPGRGTPNDWGTGYKLVLDPTDPTQGTLTKILTGNLDENGALAALQSPDNICVTENYIYWQEDPNSFARGHQAYIWQTDLNGNNPQAVLQIDFDAALDEIEGRDSDGFSGEFGALFDISDKVGEEGTFILCLQPHYWTNPDYAGIDGHDTGLGQPSGFAPREDTQGSQLVLLRGLPR